MKAFTGSGGSRAFSVNMRHEKRKVKTLPPSPLIQTSMSGSFGLAMDVLFRSMGARPMTRHSSSISTR